MQLDNNNKNTTDSPMPFRRDLANVEHSQLSRQAHKDPRQEPGRDQKLPQLSILTCTRDHNPPKASLHTHIKGIGGHRRHRRETDGREAEEEATFKVSSVNER